MNDVYIMYLPNNIVVREIIISNKNAWLSLYQDVTVVHSFTIVKWEARIVPLLMLVWAVCNMLRVARFKRTTHGDNWKYRYRTVRTGVYNLTI